MSISIEHRPGLGARARNAGTHQRRFQQAARSVITHVTVHCDARISELATCPRRQLTAAATPEEARAEAVEVGWACGSAAGPDYCPGHAGTALVSSA